MGANKLISVHWNDLEVEFSCQNIGKIEIVKILLLCILLAIYEGKEVSNPN